MSRCSSSSSAEGLCAGGRWWLRRGSDPRAVPEWSGGLDPLDGSACFTAWCRGAELVGGGQWRNSKRQASQPQVVILVGGGSLDMGP